MPIVKNNVVFISYQLAFPDEDGQPDVVEIVDEKEPMVFIHGLSGLPEAFEKNLLGLNEGDTFDFSISAEDAYGNVDPNAIIQLPKSIFQAEDQSADDILQIGNFIPMTDDQGNRMQGLVVSIEGETVTISGENPHVPRKDLKNQRSYSRRNCPRPRAWGRGSSSLKQKGLSALMNKAQSIKNKDCIAFGDEYMKCF
jgi:FKBP-type peptidyl-prolyl cis-trans isomerase SlyD